MAEIAVCPDGGMIVESGTGNANGPVVRCDVGWVIEPYNPPLTFDPATDLDPGLIAGAVGAGFFVLVPLWVAVFGVRALTGMLSSRRN